MKEMSWDDYYDGFGTWSLSTQKKHNGKCNGDCANCSPHYGYRYGRWYYGNNHSHGCQFGGDRGSGEQNIEE